MRTLNDIAAAIFDIDGTLLDSSGIWEHLGEDFLLRRGIAPQPGLAGILAPMTMEESCRFLRENYSLPQPPYSNVNSCCPISSVSSV